MDKDLRLLLIKYVKSEVAIDAVRSWVSQNIWDAQPDVDDSIDQIAIQLFHLDDGIISDGKFRGLMMALLGLIHYVEPRGQDMGYFGSYTHEALVTNTIIALGGQTARIPGDYVVTAEADAVTSSVFASLAA